MQVKLIIISHYLYLELLLLWQQTYAKKKKNHATKAKEHHQQTGKSYHLIIPLNSRPTEKQLLFTQ